MEGKNSDRSAIGRYLLDVAVVIVEDEEQRLIFGQVSYEVVDPLFEHCSRDFHARPKVIILQDHRG